MSGWNGRDRVMSEDHGDDFPAMNNITVRGQLPSDMVPAPSKYTSLPNNLNLNTSSIKNIT